MKRHGETAYATKEGEMVLVPRVCTHDALEARCRREFVEMPGLHLTLLQAARLFSLEPALCQALLDELVERGFLCCADGTYRRADLRRTAA